MIFSSIVGRFARFNTLKANTSLTVAGVPVTGEIGPRKWTPAVTSSTTLLNTDVLNATITAVGSGVELSPADPGQFQAEAHTGVGSVTLNATERGFYIGVLDSMGASDANAYAVFTDGGLTSGANSIFGLLLNRDGGTDLWSIELADLLGSGPSDTVATGLTDQDIFDANLALSMSTDGTTVTVNAYLNGTASSTPTATIALTVANSGTPVLSADRVNVFGYSDDATDFTIANFSTPTIEYTAAPVMTAGAPVIDPASYPADRTNTPFVIQGLAAPAELPGLGLVDNGYIVCFDDNDNPIARVTAAAELFNPSSAYTWEAEQTFNGGTVFNGPLIDKKFYRLEIAAVPGLLPANYETYLISIESDSQTATTDLTPLVAADADSLPWMEFELTGYGSSELRFDSNQNIWRDGASTGSTSFTGETGQRLRFQQEVTEISAGVFETRWHVYIYLSYAPGLVGLTSTTRTVVGVGAGTTGGLSTTNVGYVAGSSGQGVDSSSFGHAAAQASQGVRALSIGGYAGQNTQGDESVSCGFHSGRNNQGMRSTSLGAYNAETNQGDRCTSVGVFGGSISQKLGSCSFGYAAGYDNQGEYSVAVGYTAGNIDLADYAMILSSSGQAENLNEEGALLLKTNKHSMSITDNKGLEVDGVQIGESVAPRFNTCTRIGNSFPAGSIRGMSAISQTDVAVLNNSTAQLERYTWSGEDWSLVGTGLSLPMFSGAAITVLNAAGDLAVVSGNTDDIQAFEWAGTTYAAKGSAFSLGTVTFPDVVTISGFVGGSAAIAVFNHTGSTLQRFTFNGSTWAQNGNTYNLPVAQEFYLASLTTDAIAAYNKQANSLTRFSFNGSDWVPGTASSSISGNLVDIIGVNLTDILAYDSNVQDFLIYSTSTGTWRKAATIDNSAGSSVQMTPVNQHEIVVYSNLGGDNLARFYIGDAPYHMTILGK